MRNASSRNTSVATYAVLGGVLLVLLMISFQVRSQFKDDIAEARVRAAERSVVVQTACGPIEYQEAGQGLPVLMVHGSGGGHDQGMAFARPLAQHGMRVIAMSRFGYLRTPMPVDDSAAAQADAHACLLDALGIQQAGVLGVSAGALSSMQLAIRHPDRVSALALVVPIAYKPDTQADSAPPISAWMQKVLLRLIGSDAVFWSALKVARDQVIKIVLATPPDQVAAASASEQARVTAMANHILPVSLRAEGLMADSNPANARVPFTLEKVRAPTLLISARDDGYGTYANAQYTASQIAGAKFVGYEHGGHLLVGHDIAVRDELVQWFIKQ